MIGGIAMRSEALSKRRKVKKARKVETRVRGGARGGRKTF